ncbi:GNAT family N-acetyltransferase [Lutispora saccharofermentans]|uniref:GNAT family N-acetyltransferase n=1 Tax=Lutispora saccharofermentans TaxID=3024236 RepID=A0ABT1NJ93_9FIRM|nr:GNAT family N-acetyltransferase [Lutispora saccharofermentans]MCQ1531335.1 GNAT family N-acetyltransferase [Lutispora saccharofermentans]
MNYRRIELNGSNNDKKTDMLLMQIARWHNLTPKLWIPDYKASAADIDETIQRIKNTKREDLFIAVAEDDQGQAQGFIWACKQEKPKESVMILSLYTAEGCRRHGAATNLKALLEEWCRLEGIKTIQTTVHYNNSNMMALNQKLGYIPGMVNMTKTLL